jgi:putative two-component system response regulator
VSITREPVIPVVLCVDDSTDLLALLAKALSPQYRVLTADNAGEAISLAGGNPTPDLIVLDVDMPQVSGFEVCRALKADLSTAAIPVIFLTARTEPEAQLEGLGLGAADYVTKPINAAVLRARVALHIALATRRAELEHLVQARTSELEASRSELIRRLARVLEFHESSAAGNRVMRLANYAKLLAQAAGARPEVAEMMMKAAPLHDIGKLAVPAEILRKAEKLSAPDWERVRRHPQLGAEIIGEHADPLLKLARVLALTHHERWDGAGYPQGLKGDAIPWAGRVMAIVDSFEALTATQFHRKAVSPDAAAEEIIKRAGTKYDPALMDAFQRALPVLKQVRETYSDQLGDLIDLDFAPAAEPPKPPQTEPPKPTPPKADAASQARAAAKKYK